MSGRVLREGFPFFSVALDTLGVRFLLAFETERKQGDCKRHGTAFVWDPCRVLERVGGGWVV